MNNAGEFNTPFGSYKNTNIVNAVTLRAVSQYFRDADVRFSTADFEDILKSLPKNAFVYLDPPYLPVLDTANFTRSTDSGLEHTSQVV